MSEDVLQNFCVRVMQNETELRDERSAKTRGSKLRSGTNGVGK